MEFQFKFQTITLETKNQGVWLLAINRSESLNALNSQVLNEMADALRQIGEMEYSDARVLIITGTGDRAFVAGADIKEIAELTEDAALSFAQRGQSIFHELTLLKIPVIAAVNGFALGGGCELALACDYVFASDKAKFGLPEVSLGLIPGFGGTVRLSRAIGQRRARQLIFSGDVINAEEAYRIGLVNKIFPHADLISQTYLAVEAILTRSPKAVGVAKTSINQAWDMDVDEAQKNEAILFSELFNSADMREGTQAFIEKRKPLFKGE